MSRLKKYEVIIVGAGIAGIASAYALARAGVSNIALVDCRAPLSLTSDKSTECYRNFWPGPDATMTHFMHDSINKLQQLCAQSGNQFQLKQNGYLFATATTQQIDALAQQATLNHQYGGGELRQHTAESNFSNYSSPPTTGFDNSLSGCDLITDRRTIHRLFPYLSKDTLGVLHTRRCGSLSAQQLGMYLFEQARAAGVTFITGSFNGIQTTGGRACSITLDTHHETVELATDSVVLACGPHLKACASLAGTQLPVMVEKHVKMTMPDKLAVVPRNAPLTIWNDPIKLCWNDEEREVLATAAETRHLTETFPAGVHGRPVGAGDQLFIYWTYDCETSLQPVFPIQPDAHIAEILLRGMTRMIPGLQQYHDAMPRPYLDGGYYTKTADNRPLICPLDVPGTYACGAFSGYGIMAACAAGDLLAAHVLQRELPAYAAAFDVARFKNKTLLQNTTSLGNSGQL